MSHRPPITLEQILYIGIFVLALALRMVNLGAGPLNEFEAEQAMRAYSLAQGEAVDLGSQASYVLLSAVSFALLGSSEFLARFWPAVLGTLFVLVPYALRGTLGRSVALLFSVGLAISPGFVATSRLASGAILGVAFLVLAVLAWQRGRSILAGVLAALALSSGPSAFLGLLGLYLTWMILPVVDRRGELAAYLVNLWRNFRSVVSMRSALLPFALTLLLGTTLFLTVPQGLSGIATSFTSFLLGWIQASRVPSTYFLLAMLGYSFPALFFGLVGSIRARRNEDKLGQILGLWAAISFLLALVYPGRQITDLLWTLMPLWALAAREFAHYIHSPEQERASILSAMLLVLLLGAFLWVNAAGMAHMTVGEADYNLRLIVSGALLFLGTLALVLIAYGWSRQVASFGLAWGLGVIFFLLSISVNLRFANQLDSRANELWLQGPAAGQMHLLQDTLEELSDWQRGRVGELEVIFLSESEALGWALREWPAARSAQFINVAEEPAIILTDGLESQPSQISAYRGQSFVWSSKPDWENNLPPNPFAWLIFREGPIRSDNVTLWARSDLFPASQSAGSLNDSSGAEGFEIIEGQ